MLGCWRTLPPLISCRSHLISSHVGHLPRGMRLVGLGSTGAAGGRGDEDEAVEASEMIAQTSFDFAANSVSPAEGRKEGDE